MQLLGLNKWHCLYHVLAKQLVSKYMILIWPTTILKLKSVSNKWSVDYSNYAASKTKLAKCLQGNSARVVNNYIRRTDCCIIFISTDIGIAVTRKILHSRLVYRTSIVRKYRNKKKHMYQRWRIYDGANISWVSAANEFFQSRLCLQSMVRSVIMHRKSHFLLNYCIY